MIRNHPISFASAGLILIWGGYGAYCVTQSYIFVPSTTFLNSRIRGNIRNFHPGDSITVDAISTRYQTCDLDVFRFIRRVNDPAVMGDQEFEVGHVPQSFPANGIPLATHYDIDLPNKLSIGDYDLFSRSRYYCNGLDYIIPRYYETEHIPFTVVPKPHAAGRWQDSPLYRP